MFSGIIEEIGIVNEIILADNSSLELVINATTALIGTKIGDSIAVDGVCLTVVKITQDSFSVQVMPETYRTTTLKELQPNSRVNLERALLVGSRISGHFVSGHVDGIGVVTKKETEENALNYYISIHNDLARYCVTRGSIAINGTSLTIFDIERYNHNNNNGANNSNNSWIKLALIPHTQHNSVIGNKNLGDKVNIECDMLTKYVYHLQSQTSQITNK
jgi:riboflavin synthase